MDTVNISVCTSPGQNLADLQGVIARFGEQPGGMPPQVSEITWGKAWSELVKIALYKSETDVSQVGAAAVGDLLSMNALRPFTETEINYIGRPSQFHPIAWESALRIDNNRLWAFPWFVNVFTICYWRDMLEKAGVDPETAFSSFEHMTETFDRLQASGVAAPWVVATGNPRSMMILACMWMWAAGGEIAGPDSKQVTFGSPAARAGLKACCSLRRYMPTPAPLPHLEARSAFINRQSAVTIGSAAMIRTINRSDPSGELKSRLGIARPPGPAYIGSSNLVVWKHARQERSAIELVKFLLNKDVLVNYSQHTDDLPARLNALAAPPYSTDPHLSKLVDALEYGRSFPTLRAGGMVQDKFTEMLSRLWESTVQLSDPEREALVDEQLTQLERRLNLTLASY